MPAFTKHVETVEERLGVHDSSCSFIQWVTGVRSRTQTDWFIVWNYSSLRNWALCTEKTEQMGGSIQEHRALLVCAEGQGFMIPILKWDSTDTCIVSATVSSSCLPSLLPPPFPFHPFSSLFFSFLFSFLPSPISLPIWNFMEFFFFFNQGPGSATKWRPVERKNVSSKLNRFQKLLRVSYGGSFGVCVLHSHIFNQR